MNINWQWYLFSALSTAELYTLCAAREAVFVVEQACAYQDLDGLDFKASHLIGWSGDAVAAYLRVLPAHSRFEEPSVGRVLVMKPFRGKGFTRVAMTMALEHIAQHFAPNAVRISAQAYLEDFYCSLGFSVVAGPYMEDGIPHVEMLYPHAIASA